MSQGFANSSTTGINQLTGDVTAGPGTGSQAATIANNAVTFAKMQTVSANVLLGNDAAGTAVEEITCTAAGRALIDDADASAQRTTLGLGTLATQSGTFSGTSSGTNTGDQNIFQTIAVSGQSNVVADTTTDTLTLAAGSNVTITTNATTDTITIAASGSGGETAKVWGYLTGDGTTINASYNVTSIVDTGTGDVQININTDFASANYACVATVERTNNTTSVANSRKVNIKNFTQSAGAISLQCWDSTATNNALADPSSYHFAMFGA